MVVAPSCSNLWHQKTEIWDDTGSMTGQHPQHGVLLKPAFQTASVGSSGSGATYVVDTEVHQLQVSLVSYTISP